MCSLAQMRARFGFVCGRPNPFVRTGKQDFFPVFELASKGYGFPTSRLGSGSDKRVQPAFAFRGGL